ncbi:histamine H2 receptor-like [Orbicella faveolata]|uniref:histamine H2 receptor-like n=1 Tax=Orbicella faveolata TaxID=48498 RepID=UPI0009E3F626|nr:histamine H2 receptor-like [Orbicella faveolata]
MDHENERFGYLWQILNQRQKATVVLETIIFSLVMFLSLFGNLLVCSAVYRNPRLRQPSNYYIIFLALSDILQALFTMPLSVGMLATSNWRYGIPTCYFMVISMLSLAPASIFTMTLMALDRYYKIVNPIKYQNIFTKKFIIVTGALAWIAPILNSILTVFAFGFGVSPHPGLAICKIELKKFYFPILIIFQNSPFFVIMFCYWKIYKVVKMHNADVSWQNLNAEEVNISKTLFASVFSFVLLWVPANTILLPSYLMSGSFNSPRVISLIGTLLVFTSSCLNPFIYSFMNRSFRSEFKKCLIPRKPQSVGTDSN